MGPVTLSSKATLWTLPYTWMGQEWCLDRGRTLKGASESSEFGWEFQPVQEREMLHVGPGGLTPERRCLLSHPLWARAMPQGVSTAWGGGSFQWATSLCLGDTSPWKPRVTSLSWCPG